VVCGSRLIAANTALPFKVSETSIVLLKGLSVLECGACAEYLIKDAVMRQVDQILARVDRSIDFQIVCLTT